MKRLLALFLACLVSVAGLAQEPLPPPAPPPPDAPDSLPAAQTLSPTPLRVNPKLKKKTVVVYLRDGRTFEGKLIELTDTSLRLRIDGRDFRTGKPYCRVEEIQLTGVALIERKPSRAWIAAVVVGGAGVTVLLLVLAAMTSD